MRRRLRDTRPFMAARYRTMRTIAAVLASAIAIHALARVLLGSDRHASDWAYLGLSCAVAAVVWVLLARAAPKPPARRRHRL